MKTLKVVIGNAVLYRADCRDVLPLLDRVDAVVTDPPYGIREAGRKSASRCSSSKKWKRAKATVYTLKQWDNAPIPFDLLWSIIQMGRHAIVFGGNYYPLPPSSCWLVWDKEASGDFADCELAWTNLPKAVRRIRYLWNGFARANKEPRGDHPTQKPVGVMSWCLGHVPDARTILDPFMGSGTTGVAAIQLGRGFIGIEEDPEYFEAACRRLEQAQHSVSLLYPPIPGHSSAPVRQGLLL